MSSTPGLEPPSKRDPEKEIVERVTSMEYSIGMIQDDVAHIKIVQARNRQDSEDLQANIGEVLDYIRNVRQGAKVVRGTASWLGKQLVWIAKFAGAIAVLYGIGVAVKNGHVPDIRLP